MLRNFVLVIAAIAVACGGGDREQARTQTSTPAPVPAQTSRGPEPVARASAPVVACTPAALRLCPVDEGASDASLVAFRAQLADAVQRRDAAALKALVDPKVRTSFGEGGGWEDFQTAWKLPSPDSALWPELAQIQALGGSFQGEGSERTFWTPYVYANWPDDVDAFEYVAAIRGDVPIFEKPDAGAAKIATAQWDLLKVIGEPGEEQAWRHVRTREGKEGWARSADVRSPIGYRAGLSNRSGSWKLETLVAGD